MKSCAVSTAIVSACVCTTPIVSARDVMTASIACERERERATRKWAQRALGWMGAWRAGRRLGAGWARAGVACQQEVDVRDAAGVGPHALSRLLQHLAAAQPPGSRAARCPHPARNNTSQAAPPPTLAKAVKRAPERTGRNARNALPRRGNRNSLTSRRQPGAYTLDLREPRTRAPPARGLARGTP